MKRKKRKILFVNPNRYVNPPVIPLGIEYLTHSLESHGFEVAVLDLSFSGDPFFDLESSIRDIQPHAICMTVRNVDSVLYPETDYFLPEIREYIRHIRNIKDLPVIIGGSAMPADPEGILDFLGADIAVEGPGEESLPSLLNQADILRQKGKVIRGDLPQSFCPKRGRDFPYKDYLEKGGLPGFETHKGCSSACAYCMEAGAPRSFRKTQDVVCELRQLADQGFNHLHLCDSEFNEDLDYSLALLEALTRENLGLKWALYMKPGNYNRKLFELLRRSGAYLVTLSVDTLHKDNGYWKDVSSMVRLCKASGIRISMDFLTGFPYEKEGDLKRSLDFFRDTAPSEVVVNVFIRLYKKLPITHIIIKDLSLDPYLIRAKGNEGSLLAPTFYNHIPTEKLRELIGHDPMFRIAGAEKVVNYQKAP